VPGDDWQDIPEWQAMQRFISYAPIAAVILVIIVALGLDLKFGAPGQPKVANSAPPPEVIRATVAAQPTSATPQAPVPTATTTPAPAVTVAPASDIAFRDQTRVGDLMRIAAALNKYHQKNGKYPDTGGNIQSVCTYEDIDAGCKLKEFLNPIPEDPLGSSTINGYWYSSDGTTYTLVAGMESATYPSPKKCEPDVVEHTGKQYLYCTGPS
jgi:hypothetical protein